MTHGNEHVCLNFPRRDVFMLMPLGWAAWLAARAARRLAGLAGLPAGRRLLSPHALLPD